MAGSSTSSSAPARPRSSRITAASAAPSATRRPGFPVARRGSWSGCCPLVAERKPGDYSGMAMERSRWTDDRLDDLAGAITGRFDRVDNRFDQVDNRFDQVE